MNTSTPNIYTLSLHDALPIFPAKSIFNNLYASLAQAENKQTSSCVHCHILLAIHRICHRTRLDRRTNGRSEEHTSELQSLTNLVCRLLLEKKKKKISTK